MSNNKENNAFIKHLHLKGFKSIVDLEVSLQNGLNVVIGANGSGKTNFVEFLEEILTNNAMNITKPYFFQFEFKSKKGTTNWHQKFEGELYIDYPKTFSVQSKIDKPEEEGTLQKIANNRLNIFMNLSRDNFDIYGILYPCIIEYKIPNSLGMLDEQGRILHDNDDFFSGVYSSIYYNVFDIDLGYNFRDNNIFEFKGTNQDFINTFLPLSVSLIKNLQKFSPVKNLRINPGVVINTSKEKFSIDYITLEFYVNEEWLRWSELSDGTKRIFYIISQVTNGKKLIIIEEPENGVHPDQLYLLMDFIKEQAKEKQIIVTTHSPEVLNFIEKDELDRIIVTRYDNEKKTQMHHLSEKTKKKAIWYMENKGMLSDCWVHTKSFEEYDASEA